MAKLNLHAQYDGAKHRVDIRVDIISWEENNIHFHYAPALDLTGYGHSAQEAKESFHTQLDDFVNYTMNKGTVYDELERLGWTVNKKKKRVVAPANDELLADNETYRNLLDKQTTQKGTTNLELAL